MVQLAVYDAINSIDPRYQSYAGIQVKAGRDASEVAAVAGRGRRGPQGQPSQHGFSASSIRR